MPRRRQHRPAATQYWIGYPRKSTDAEDKQVHSLQDQTAMIQASYEQLPAAERHGRPLKLLEEARSAYHPGRPVFRSILDLADQGAVHGVLVVHPNRISRNHADSGAFVQRLVDGKIRCLATTGGQRYTADDSNAIFMLTLEGAMSWKDSRDKGERILQAMRLRAAEGRHMGSVRIGYRVVYHPDGSKSLEIVQETGQLLRRLFSLAATGTYSVQALAAEASKMGLRSRTGRKLWGSVVHSILRDPLYKGFIRFDGVVARGQHEPLVEVAVWDRVQSVLTGRSRHAARAKDTNLRDLFFFGNLLRCPLCGRTLCPYRVKQKYVYYECKNLETRCGVLVPQPVLVEQLPRLLRGIRLEQKDLNDLRTELLRQHRERSGRESGQRSGLNAEYERVVKQIGDLFAQRKEAEALGVLAEADAQLVALRTRRDELQVRLNACHEEGSDWIEKVIRSFALIELLEEAIFLGSARPREMVLKGLASNYSVEGKKLVWKPRAPFRQAGQKAVCPEWCTGLYDVRTEILETFELLQAATAWLPVLR